MMKNSRYLNLAGLLGGLSILGIAISANATNVDVELAIILDSSSNVTNFNAQKQAYYNIFTQSFTDPDTGQLTNFYDYFVAPLQGINIDGNIGIGKIAVSTIQFASDAVVTMPWAEIGNQSQAIAFGNRFLGISQFTNNGDNLGGAIQLATQGITNNSYTGSHLSFGIVSDGVSVGSNPSVSQASSNALNSGVDVINAVAPNSSYFSNFQNIVGGQNFYDDPCSLFAVGQCSYPVSGSNAFVVSEAVINVNNLATANITPSANPLQAYYNTLINQLRLGIGTPIPQAESVPEPSLISALVTLGLLGILTQKKGDRR